MFSFQDILRWTAFTQKLSIHSCGGAMPRGDDVRVQVSLAANKVAVLTMLYSSIQGPGWMRIWIAWWKLRHG